MIKMQNLKFIIQKGKVKSDMSAAGGFRHFAFPHARERAGFTLLEMIISLGIFSVVIITAVGAMLAIGNAQTKVAAIQNIQDNLRFVLESMTKEMRTGANFKGDTPSGSGYRVITFTRRDGMVIQYCVGNTAAIQKITTPGASVCDVSKGSPTTDTAVFIDGLLFYLVGSEIGARDGQPRITISLSAHSVDPKLQTSFRLQTTVTQRSRDNP